MIYKKLAEFRKKNVVLKKDTTALNYKYATLSQIQEKIDPILDELKLVVVHYAKDGCIVTQVRDLEDDTFVESSLAIWVVESKRVEKFRNEKKQSDVETVEYNSLDPQGVGSIFTYYRRYNLVGILDLETEDDDGAVGSVRSKIKEVTKPSGPVEIHICKKCWAEQEAVIQKGEYWPFFKCSSCGKFSNSNKKNKDKEPLFETPKWDSTID